MKHQPQDETATFPLPSCEECKSLLAAFTEAVHTLGSLQQAHITAMVNCTDSKTLENLIGVAGERKWQAKDAYLDHRRGHKRPPETWTRVNAALPGSTALLPGRPRR
jgi:hypothetical protein